MATVDATTTPDAQRAQRADARRNRERLLAAAAEAFAEEGFTVGVAEIARRAGVGTGTLFRHFPTKLDLEVAVVLQHKEALGAALDEALAEPDPWDAFAHAMTRGVELMARDRCLGQAASPELLADPRIHAMRETMLAAFDALLRRGREAGVVRPEVTPEDIPVLVTAVAVTIERFGAAREDLWRRYLGVVLDGLRAGGSAGGELAPGPPTLAELDAACAPPDA